VAKGLARLPVEQRVTLELAYGAGHSLEEIASIMDCQVTTVKARMFHARVKLRNVLPVLAGEGGPARDLAVLNAGAAVYVSGRVDDLEEGTRAAEAAIDSGAAAAALERLVTLTGELAPREAG
jgi:anthranilate phosphoribosyltransferase